MNFLASLFHAFGPCEWFKLAIAVAMLAIVIHLALEQKP
jgi:hypothetical protein